MVPGELTYLFISYIDITVPCGLKPPLLFKSTPDYSRKAFPYDLHSKDKITELAISQWHRQCTAANLVKSQVEKQCSRECNHQKDSWFIIILIRSSYNSLYTCALLSEAMCVRWRVYTFCVCLAATYIQQGTPWKD